MYGAIIGDIVGSIAEAYYGIDEKSIHQANEYLNDLSILEKTPF